ncbi:MAG: LptF/LptG family permease [Sphingomonas sp.]|uniref:LptF/LptG family permease n=1 Tax=Sphingomonas sp. TaxID=28214 RepID=UPI003F7E3CEC
MGGILDRYLFRQAALRLAAFTVIILVILTLENASRLAADVDRSNAPFRLLARLSLALVPEHLSAALPVALLLAIALSVRAMALRGEWQILPAAGMGRNRALLGLIALAIVVSGLVLADRFEWLPAGDRALDATYLDLRTGKYGLPLPIGESIALDDKTTLFVSGSDGTGQLTGVVIQRDDRTFFAARARVFDEVDKVALILSRGVGVIRFANGAAERFRFDTLRIAGQPPVIGTVVNNFRHRLDRLSADGLVRLAKTGDPASANAALMALMMRLDSALFCLLLPWMGAILGTPASRRHTAVGIGLGILLVVAHLKSAAFVEDAFAAHALVAEVVHALCWLAMIRSLVLAETRHGEGFVETAFSRVARALVPDEGARQRGRVWFARHRAGRNAAW